MEPKCFQMLICVNQAVSNPICNSLLHHHGLRFVFCPASKQGKILDNAQENKIQKFKFKFLDIRYKQKSDNFQEPNVDLVHNGSHISWSKNTCTASDQVHAEPSKQKILQTWARNQKNTNHPPWTEFKRALTTRVEEANLGGSVLPRQQSVLLFEAIAKEVKGFKFEENRVLTRLFWCQSDKSSAKLRLRKLDLSGSYLSHVDPKGGYNS